MHARLTAASDALGDYRTWAAGAAVPGDWQAWAQRLALELASVCTALRGALTMLADSDQVVAEQDSSMLLGTGGLSIAPADATTVTAALGDAAHYRPYHGDDTDADAVSAARYLSDIASGRTWRWLD